MILTTLGMVLSRRNVAESDRIAEVYTKDLGRLSVRFGGVNRSRGKLKALSEPMVLSDFRLYWKPGAEFARAIGGEILNSFPGVRSNWEKTLEALHLCELMLKLTPPQQPNAEKFSLLTQGLDALENSNSPWIRVAFAARLLHVCGFSLAEMPPSKEDRSLWEILHAAPWPEIAAMLAQPDSQHLERLRGATYHHLEQHLEMPLRTCAFL